MVSRNRCPTHALACRCRRHGDVEESANQSRKASWRATVSISAKDTRALEAFRRVHQREGSPRSGKASQSDDNTQKRVWMPE